MSDDTRARAAAEEQIAIALGVCSHMNPDAVAHFIMPTVEQIVADAVAQAVKEVTESRDKWLYEWQRASDFVKQQAEEIARLNSEHDNYVLMEGARVQAAVAVERERCAKIIEGGTWLFQAGVTLNAQLVAETRADMAAALRAPGRT